VIKRKPKIEDYDIREHQDFHKYVNRKNVKSCDNKNILKTVTIKPTSNVGNNAK